MSRHADDYERKLRPAPIYRPAETIEQGIRARERQTVRWLAEKPWLDGRALADTIRACRRAHTESIARSRANGDLT